MATFGELLGQFKGSEEPENICPLVDEDELRSGVLAWKSVDVTIKCDAGDQCEEKDPVRQWNWLWDQVEFDSGYFGVVAGCRAQDATSLHLRLRGLRLIYPDGTIHQYAAQYLQAIIMAKLKKAT